MISDKKESQRQTDMTCKLSVIQQCSLLDETSITAKTNRVGIFTRVGQFDNVFFTKSKWRTLFDTFWDLDYSWWRELDMFACCQLFRFMCNKKKGLKWKCAEYIRNDWFLIQWMKVEVTTPVLSQPQPWIILQTALPHASCVWPYPVKDRKFSLRDAINYL